MLHEALLHGCHSVDFWVSLSIFLSKIQSILWSDCRRDWHIIKVLGVLLCESFHRLIFHIVVNPLCALNYLVLLQLSIYIISYLIWNLC
jgi:hypothetical protein